MWGFRYEWIGQFLVAENQGAECLNPPDGYASLNTHGAIRIMYQELMNNCRNSSNYDAVNIIRPVTIPTGVGDESVEVRLQDYAAHAILEAL